MNKYFILCLLLLACLIPRGTHATSNYGFVPKGLYLSKEAPEEGEVVTIYASIFNNSDASFSVKVSFYDGIILLGTKDSTVFPKDTQLTSIAWNVSAGSHALSARLLEATLINANGMRTSVYVDPLTITGPVFTTAKNTSNDRMFYSGDPSQQVILREINSLEEFLATIIPTKLTNGLSDLFLGLELVRLDTAAQVRVSVDQSNTKIKNFAVLSPSEALSPAYLYVDRPLAYSALFFFTISAFVLSHQLTFYTLLLASVILVCRRSYLYIRALVQKYQKVHHS